MLELRALVFEDAAKLTATDRTVFGWVFFLFFSIRSGHHQRASGVEMPRWNVAGVDREEGPMLQAALQEGPMS